MARPTDASSVRRPDAGAVAIAIEDLTATSPLMAKKRSRESYPAAIFLTTLPSLAILTAMLVSFSTQVPMDHWLVDPLSVRLALSQNFISAWIVAAPIPFTAALIEAMYSASKTASETPAEKWSTREGLDDARARARTTSTAEKLILPTGCLAVVALILTYYFPTFDWVSTKVWFCLLVTLLVTVVLLMHTAFRSLREGLVCRERGNALAYFYARAPTLLATIALQCSVFAFVFWEDLYILPVTPVGYLENFDACIDLGSNYTAENCHLAVDLAAAGIWTEGWQVNTAIEPAYPLAVGGAVWVCNDEYRSGSGLVYTSALAACRASGLVLHMFGRLCGGLPFNTVLLFVVAFREMLVGVDAEITWSNWAARGTGRMKGAIILASIGTLPYLPFYLLSMLVAPSVGWSKVGLYGGLEVIGFDIICWILAFALLHAEFYVRRISHSGDLLLHDGSSLKAKLAKIVSELPVTVCSPSAYTPAQYTPAQYYPPALKYRFPSPTLTSYTALNQSTSTCDLQVLARSDSNEIAAVDHAEQQSTAVDVENKLTGDVRHLKTGDAADAAKGVNEFMKVGIDFEIGKVGEGVRRIKQEFLEVHKSAQMEYDSAVERGEADEEIEKLRQRLDNAASDMEYAPPTPFHEHDANESEAFAFGTTLGACFMSSARRLAAARRRSPTAA